MLSRFRFPVRRSPAVPKRALIAGVALIAIIALVLMFRPTHPSLGRIAIGGGAYQGINRSESIQALDANWDKGFRTFLIDFRWTSDRALVCIPNWQEGAAAIFQGYTLSNPPHAMSLAEFTTQPTIQNIRPCTLDTLAAWLKNHSGATIIANIPPQAHAMEAFQLIKNTVGDTAHILPQVYSGNEYRAVIAMGYARAMLALPNPPHPPNIGKLRDGLKIIKPYAVAIPADRAGGTDPLMQRLKEANAHVYATGGVDDCAELKRLHALGVIDAYTNQLSPQDCPL